MAELIQSYGYWIVFLGTLVEGETVLVLGGIAAHRGYLDLTTTIFVAFLGSFTCDQAFFHLGRRHGPSMLARRPGWKPAVARVDRLFARYSLPMILGFRFLYGLRTVAPFAMGMSGAIETRRFVILNLVGAAIWSILVGGAGYLMGNAVEAVIGKARHYEVALFAAVAGIGVVIWIVHFLRRRAARRRREHSAD